MEDLACASSQMCVRVYSWEFPLCSAVTGFVVLHGDGVLRTLATGYVGGAETGDHQLTVVSPNMLDRHPVVPNSTVGACVHASCHVEYSCTPRADGMRTADEEVRRCVSHWAAKYGCSRTF